jgi:GH24 family phage-related lysozyme (muramidase)
MLDTATYLPKLKVFEGSVPYMYLDTTGNVTVGVGKMLPNAAAAQKLGFIRRPDPLGAAGYGHR